MTPMIGMPEGAEWLVILVIVIIVFGAAKLPELARGTGQALRIFKAETKGLRDDDTDPKVKKSELPTAMNEEAKPGESIIADQRATIADKNAVIAEQQAKNAQDH